MGFNYPTIQAQAGECAQKFDLLNRILASRNHVHTARTVSTRGKRKKMKSNDCRSQFVSETERVPVVNYASLVNSTCSGSFSLADAAIISNIVLQ
jgi:hypothetical protein